MEVRITNSATSTSDVSLPPLRQSTVTRKDYPVPSPRSAALPPTSSTSRPQTHKDTSHHTEEGHRSYNSGLEGSLSGKLPPREDRHSFTGGNAASFRSDTPDPDEQLAKTTPVKNGTDFRNMVPLELLSTSLSLAQGLCMKSTACKEGTYPQDTGHRNKANKLCDEYSDSEICVSPTIQGNTSDEDSPDTVTHEFPSYDTLRKAQDRFRDLLQSKRSLDFAFEMELKKWRGDLHRHKSSLKRDEKTTSQIADQKHAPSLNDSETTTTRPYQGKRTTNELQGQAQRKKNSVLDTTDGELEVKDDHIEEPRKAHKPTAGSKSSPAPDLPSPHNSKKDRKLEENGNTPKEHNDTTTQCEDKGVAREVAQQALVCAAMNLIVWNLGYELGGHSVAMAIFMIWRAVACD